MKTTDILALRAALGELDGYLRIVKDGERERIVREPYKLGAGLRLAIAKNIARTKEPVEAYVTARNAIIRELANGDSTVTGVKEMGELQQRDEELLKAEHDVELIQFKVAELNLDANPIPASVIMAIMPALEDIYIPGPPKIEAGVRAVMGNA